MLLPVDDKAGIVELIAMVLDAGRVAVLTAGDGLEALEIARREHPQLVLTDITKPRMYGVELCRRLQEEPATRDTAVRLKSAARGVDLSGCDPVCMIRKPFDLWDLVTTVRNHLGYAD